MKTKSNSLAAMGVAAFLSVATAIGAPVTMYKEGVRLTPYYDSVGKLTWCVGETEKGYKKKFTFEECGVLYTARYGYYSTRTQLMYNSKAAHVVTPKMHAAFTDMSYNVGIGRVSSSTMIKRLNAGDARGACDAILLYKYAGGFDCSTPGNKVCAGVWTRRVEMHKMCLEGVDDTTHR